MTDGLADTSLFITTESGREVDEGAVPDRLAISVVTLGELRAGVLAAADTATRHLRLTTMGWALRLDPLVIDDRVAEAWAALRLYLRELGRRMPVNDSWIAATAIAHELPVVTQDDDYAVGVPGLTVIRV